MTDQIPTDTHSNISMFVKQIAHIKNMVLSDSIPNLIETTRTAIKRILRAEKVDFLLMDRELVAHYKESNGKTQKFYHAHFPFQIAVPFDFDLKKSTYPFTPCFKMIKDVQLNRHNKGRICVWPVSAEDNSH